MRRREFVAVASLLGMSCEGGGDMLMGQAPWHMWGTTEVLSIPITSGPTQPLIRTGEQLSRINYKHPTAWCFWLGARLVGGDTLGTETGVRLQINLSHGVGRGMFQTEEPAFGFSEFRWIVPGGTTPGGQLRNVKYTDRVLGPPLDDTAPNERREINRITFQDMQVSVLAWATNISAAPTTRIRIQVSAFFAPVVHVRPDWFNRWGKLLGAFRGGELGGS